MRLNGKEVRIVVPRKPCASWNDEHEPAKYTREDQLGYVYLQHSEVYSIWLQNSTGENNDVVVEIDGKEVGCWRLKPHQSVTIERPADDSGQFTFYEIGSREARAIGLNSIARSDLGLVRVTFIPEKPRHEGIPAMDTVRESYSGAKGGGGMKGGDWSESFSSSSRGGGQSVNLHNRSAGGTGLSGRSNQKFGTAGAIDRDYDRQVVINLRLVAKPNSEPRPLRAVNSTVSNLVPPPVN